LDLRMHLVSSIKDYHKNNVDYTTAIKVFLFDIILHLDYLSWIMVHGYFGKRLRNFVEHK
jgi:hypothetical protein